MSQVAILDPPPPESRIIASHPAGTGAHTIEPSALLARVDFAKLVEKRLGNPINFNREDGMLVVKYTAPITAREARSVVLRHYKSCGTPETDKAWIGRITLLGSAGKMGCWGFSLPAGPPSLLGTCVGSVVGFPMLEERARKIKLSPEAQQTGIDLTQFICSGCYALKGRYASPLMLTVTETRRQVVKNLLRLGIGAFADVFEQAILMAQAKSMRRYRYQQRKGTYEADSYSVQNPAFFRLHDAGDWLSKQYLLGWMEVAKRFQRPRFHAGFNLPSIVFWAPTRVWSVAKSLGADSECPVDHDLRCLPSNMVVRPSSLHFNELAPRLEGFGYAGGSASGKADVWSHLAAWRCPAYLPPQEGGGAEPHQRLGEKQWVQGCCARSQGPGARAGIDSDLPSPQGHGCRVCWLDPSRTVVYQEH